MDARVTESVPPEAVQRWSASDYAKNGQFVPELAGAIFAMLGPKPGERVLDLGCGDGTLTAEIRAAGADVLGVDLSEELLAVARMKGLAVQKADGHALDFVQDCTVWKTSEESFGVGNGKISFLKTFQGNIGHIREQHFTECCFS